MIYFIQRTDTGLIKIGWTNKSAGQRLKEVWWQAKQAPTIGLALCFGGRVEEAILHERFKHLRTENEWFIPGDDLIDFIQRETDPWDSRASDQRHGPLDPAGGCYEYAVNLDGDEARFITQAAKECGIPRSRMMRRIYLFWKTHDPDGSKVKNFSWYTAVEACPTSQVSDQ